MILLKKAKEEDLEFLLKLKKESMGDYIEQTWGWDPNWQRENVFQHLDLKRTLIVIKSGKRIGWLSIFRTKKSITFENFALLPEYHNLGIGTKVFKKVISISTEESKPLYLQVLKVNTQAQDLFKRLGFIITGENNSHFFMRYNATNNNKNRIN